MKGRRRHRRRPSCLRDRSDPGAARADRQPREPPCGPERVYAHVDPSARAHCRSSANSSSRRAKSGFSRFSERSSQRSKAAFGSIGFAPSGRTARWSSDWSDGCRSQAPSGRIGSIASRPASKTLRCGSWESDRQRNPDRGAAARTGQATDVDRGCKASRADSPSRLRRGTRLAAGTPSASRSEGVGETEGRRYA